jgi:phage terminase large subunit-like protein/soluble P-type ATPase
MTELGDLYTTVKLQAIAEDDLDVVFPCTGEVWHINKGDSLFPERFSIQAYENIKKQAGQANFDTQYQQNDVSGSDNVIKLEYIQYMNEYDAEDIIENYDHIYASHDLPVSEKESADMHGAVICYKKGSTLLFTDAIETHFGFIGSQSFIKTLSSEDDYRGIIQLIENKANGAVVIQTLQSTVPGVITIEPGSRSKTERLKAASYWMIAKNVFFLTNRMNQVSPAIKMLISRITAFPYVKHDDVVDFVSHSGRGLEGLVEGKKVILGNKKLMQEHKVDFSDYSTKIEQLEGEAKSVILLAEGESFLGIIAVADAIKEDSQEAIARLHTLGFKTAMISGDNQKTAQAIANKVNIDFVVAEVLPDQKVEQIKKFQNEYGLVAMVGDGINDAPALKQANVGIALGTGTDIAIESADIAIVKGSLMSVVQAVKLSQETFKKIKQNLFWAFAYNLIAIPLAFAGMLHPVIAEIAMATSSITVVTNSNMLRRKSIK